MGCGELQQPKEKAKAKALPRIARIITDRTDRNEIEPNPKLNP
jgi:hypothetical protein